MVSAHYLTSPGPAPTFQNGKSELDGATLDDWGDAAQAYLAINSPGYANNRALKSPKAEPAFTSLPTDAAADFGCQPAGYSEYTPQPLVSIQLADEDEDANTPMRSSKSKGSIYRRVWGSGPSPILQRHIQRYSLRSKLNKSLGDRSSIADSPGNGEISLTARVTQSARPSDQGMGQANPSAAQLYNKTPVRQRPYSSGGSRACKPPDYKDSSTCSPAVASAQWTPEARRRTAPAPEAVNWTPSRSPASAAVNWTPEPSSATPQRRSATPSLSAASRAPAGRARSCNAPAAAFRTPETRLPRVAYLTPGTKIPAPGSPLAYRTTASSPGPNSLTPSSALRQSPAAGSGHKAIQYQPRGLAVIRHMAAASTNGSGAWPGTSPARSDVVAKPSPTMARTLDGLLLAEDIVAALVASAVEMAENGAKQSARSNGGTARPLRQKLAVVSEGDRADVASEHGDGSGPDCRCNVM